jgi:hypothetical protein
MATTITIQLSPIWAKAPIEKLVDRVESILIGCSKRSSFVSFENAGSDGIWQIDGGNDWSMYVRDETLHIVARYRFADDPLIEGLKVVLDWAVGKQ